MTKPVVVEKTDNAPGVLHVDTESWKRGPGASPEKVDVKPAPADKTPEWVIAKP